MGFLRTIKPGVKNLWAWLPVIWNDRQWDQSWFYEILRFKLNRMEKYFANGLSQDSPEQSARMHRCCLILDRLIKEDYVDYGKEKNPIEKEEYLIKQDLDRLFSNIKKYIREWWD